MKIYVDLDHVDITEYTQIESGEYNTNKINFIFTPEYKDLVKVAIFGCKLDTDEPKFYKIYLSDDSCYLPQEVTSASDVISIGVYAFNVDNGELKLRYSPTPVKTIVYEGSFREEAENSSSPTPTEIEQIMSRIISLEEITSDLNTRVEALENKACDLDTLKSDVAELKDDVENISKRVDTIESDIDDLEGDIANTYSKTEVDSLLGSKVDTSTFNSSQAAQDEKIAKAELILSQLPKVTGEGTNFSLSPTIEYDLDIKSYKGDTIQEGTPTSETPIPIQVVTGTQEIEVVGKNLFNGIYVNAFTGGASPYPYAENSDCRSGIVKVQPSTTYSISKGTSNRFRVSEYATYPQVSVNAIKYNSAGDSNTVYTFTTQATTQYLLIQVTNEGQDNVQMLVEVGSATTYSPYTSISYTLHLGDEELAKIGTYQDKIYYDNGKWYLRKEIGKVVYTGNEEWTKNTSTSNSTRSVFYTTKPSDLYDYTDVNSKLLALSNKFIANSQAATWKPYDIGYSKNTASRINFIIEPDASLEMFKSIINGTNMYYASTGSTTEITNTTLLQDLNYIKEHISSFPDTTNISTSGNLPIIITASALKQLS